MIVVCGRCGVEHDDIGSGSPTQGWRCAASVHDQEVYGHYGSTVIDMASRPIAPEANLPNGLDPLCDGCIQSLDAAGLLGLEQERGWGGAHVGLELGPDGKPSGRWTRIDDLDAQARAELADLFEAQLDALEDGTPNA
jgi:hypothetical protein